MFTGIVRGVGRVLRRAARGGGVRLVVEPPADFPPVDSGASVAVDGCCLTAVEAAPAGEPIGFDLSEETLARTRLGGLEPGERVNLEPSLAVGDPLGGHFVTGHVDALGIVRAFDRVGDFAELEVELPGEGPGAVRPGFVAEKGSIAVNGVSLTVASWDRARRRFRAALIPETLRRTNLGDLAPSDAVQIEYDLLARYLTERAEAREQDL